MYLFDGFLPYAEKIEECLKTTFKWNAVARSGELVADEPTMSLQHDCLLEELGELKYAFEQKDNVETLDAICDMLFVAAYASLLQSGNELSVVYNVLTHCESSGLERKPMQRFITRLEILVEGHKYQELCSELINFGVASGCDFFGAYREVTDSNWSKFPLACHTDLDMELDYFEEESKYNDVCVEEYNGYYIFRCDGGDGKVVKPSTFIEPDLEGFLVG